MFISYDTLLSAFSRVPRNYSFPDTGDGGTNFPNTFLAFPICFVSSTQFSILPLLPRFKAAAEKLLKFEKFGMHSALNVHPTEIAENKVYGLCYRGKFCRIQILNSGWARQYDCGSLFGVLDKDKLFVLPPDIESIPCLRHRAAMSRLECLDKKKGNIFLKNKCSNSLFLVDKADIINCKGSVVIIATFYSIDKEINYNELVVQNGYAMEKGKQVVTKPKLPPFTKSPTSNFPQCGNSSPVKEPQTISVPQLHQEKPGSVPLWSPGDKKSFKIYSTSIISPDTIWAQPFHESTSSLLDLMEEMNQLYLSSASDSYTPLVGDFCVAKYYLDELFYRAEVVSVGTSEVLVQFLDYGNTEIVSLDDVRRIKSTFLALPRQAVRFILSNVRPVDEVWSKEACDLVKEMMLENVVQIDIVSEEDSGFVVNARCDSGGPLINDVLIEKGYAIENSKLQMKGVGEIKKLIKIGRGSAFQFVQTEHKVDTSAPIELIASSIGNPVPISKVWSPTDSLIRNFITDTKPSENIRKCYSASSDSQFVASKAGTPLIRKVQLASNVVESALKTASLPNGVMNAVITHINNPLSFYIVLTDSHSYVQLTRMVSDLQSRKLLTLRDVFEGINCVAKNPYNGLYQRGKVVKLSQNEAVVQFVDFGYTDTVGTSKLFTLDKVYCGVPCQAIHCSLHALPATLERDSSDVIECFKALTCDQALQVEKVSASDGIYFVKISSNGTEIIKKIEASLMATSNNSPSPVTKFSTLQTLNIPNESTDEYVNVRLSHVVSPDKLFLHLVFEPYFSQLANLMSWSYKNLQPFDCRLQLDDVCIALFLEDESWYRARIIDSSQDDVYVLHFFDFGNTETVAVDNVRVCPEGLLSLPVMALECSLSGIVPASGSDWDSLSSQFLSDNFLNKILVAKFEDDFNVTLYDTTGAVDVNISNTLIDQGFAVSASNIVTHKISIPNFSFSDSNLTLNVTVSDVMSLSLLWLQDVSLGSQNLYSQLQSALQSHCSKAKACLAGALQDGDFCCVAYDGQYFRAKVIHANEDEKIFVLLVDYGIKDYVHQFHIYPITQTLAELPAFSFCASLNGGTDTPDATAQFLEYTKGKVFQVKVIDSTSLPPCIEMFDSSGQNVLHQVHAVPLLETLPTMNTSSLVMASSICSAALPSTDEFHVLAVHVKNLHKMYFQLLDNVKLLIELTEKVEKFSVTAPVLTTAPVVGQFCLANSDVHGCYRAEVVSCDGSTCVVKSLDYGNDEVLNCSNLRDVTSDLVNYPKQAFECSLVGIDDSSSSDAIHFIKKQLLINEPVICRVYSRFHCLLVDFSVDTTTTTRNLLSQKNLLPSFSSSKYELPSVSLVSSGTCTVASTDVVSPWHFWLQKADEKSFLDISNNFVQLQAHCTMASLPEQPITLGELVCTKFSGDGLWYRGRVVDISDDLPLVHFVDYGNSEKAQVSNMRSLNAELCCFPAQAILCSLDAPFNDQVLSSTFKKLLDDKYLDCTFIRMKDGCKSVVDLVERGTERNIKELLANC